MNQYIITYLKEFNIMLRKAVRPVRRIVNQILYYGRKYVCPVCEHSFRKFLSFGHPKRINVRCPSCASLERHRLIWMFLQNKTEFFRANLRVLHFAPELGFFEKIKKMGNISYIPADINPFCSEIKKVDITNITYDDNYFNCVICCHVLEHIPDDRLAIREVFRVLKSGGWAILQVPIDRIKTFEDPTAQTPEARLRIYGQSDHVRIYGLDYVERLEEAGFKVKTKSCTKMFDKEIIRKYGLPQYDIYLCEKP